MIRDQLRVMGGFVNQKTATYAPPSPLTHRHLRFGSHRRPRGPAQLVWQYTSPWYRATVPCLACRGVGRRPTRMRTLYGRDRAEGYWLARCARCRGQGRVSRRPSEQGVPPPVRTPLP